MPTRDAVEDVDDFGHERIAVWRQSRPEVAVIERAQPFEKLAQRFVARGAMAALSSGGFSFDFASASDRGFFVDVGTSADSHGQILSNGDGESRLTRLSGRATRARMRRTCVTGTEFPHALWMRSVQKQCRPLAYVQMRVWPVVICGVR